VWQSRTLGIPLHDPVRCSVAVCCSVFQYVAVCSSILLCVRNNVVHWAFNCMPLCVAVCCNVMQCVAVFWKQSCTLGIQLHDPVCCRAFQYIEVCCSVSEAKSYTRLCVLQCVAVYCSVLQHEKQNRTIRTVGIQLYDHVCCSVLQYIAVRCSV